MARRKGFWDSFTQGWNFADKARATYDDLSLKNKLNDIQSQQPVEEVTAEVGQEVNAPDPAQHTYDSDTGTYVPRVMAADGMAIDKPAPALESPAPKFAEGQKTSRWKVGGISFDTKPTDAQVKGAKMQASADAYRAAGMHKDADQLEAAAITREAAQMELDDKRQQKAASKEIADSFNKEEAELQAAGKDQAFAAPYSTDAARDKLGAQIMAQNAADVQAGTADPITPAQLSQIKGVYRDRSRGIPMPAETQAKYGMWRAEKLMAAGRYKEANEARAEAKGAIANGLVGALISENPDQAMRLYNAYPNGEDVSSVQFGKDGKVKIVSNLGERSVDKTQIIIGAMQQVEPKTAYQMYLQAMRSDAASETMKLRMETQLALMGMKIDAGLARVAGGGGSGSGSSSGSGGKKAADPHGQTTALGLSRDDYNKQWGEGDPDANGRGYEYYTRLRNNARNTDQVTEAAHFTLSRDLAMGKAKQVVDWDDKTFSFRLYAQRGDERFPLSGSIDPAKTMASAAGEQRPKEVAKLYANVAARIDPNPAADAPGEVALERRKANLRAGLEKAGTEEARAQIRDAIAGVDRAIVIRSNVRDALNAEAKKTQRETADKPVRDDAGYQEASDKLKAIEAQAAKLPEASRAEFLRRQNADVLRRRVEQFEATNYPMMP